ncbi:MAG: peptidase S9 [Bacteroidetes bacterium GWA2_31_9]|nr:MAG: peptidase S9 [Bacteroidetes bacterium GWA2_31_9]
MQKLIFISLFLITLQVVAQDSLQNITLEDIWAKYTFYPKSISGLNSMKDGENYTVLEANQNIVKYSYKKGTKVATIFDFNLIKPTEFFDISEYTFSSDESKILITTNEESIYRHSFKADFFVYDIKTKKLLKLTDKGKIQLAEFSPDGSKVAYMRDNNLYYKTISDNIETEITNDGKINEIINGAPDWVYEEEFGFSKAFFWSSDSKKIAYYKFNESRVKEFNMTMYGELYPEWYKYKYPKAGEDNSIVTIHLYDLSSKAIKNVEIGTETNQYIPRVKWTNNPDILSFIRLNRLQNKMEILLADAKTGKSNVIYTEENKCYIDINDDLTFLKDNKSFIISSEKEGYNQLYHYDLNGNLINKITKEKYDVTKFLGIDESKSLIYYESAQGEAFERKIMTIILNGTNQKILTDKDGVNEVNFSTNFKYFIWNNSSARLLKVTLNTSDGKEIRVLEDNSDLTAKMKSYKFATKKFLTIENSESDKLNAWMIYPSNFNPEKKYPVFMYVYGGPGNQTVMNEWSYNDMWFQYLSQLGYFIVSVDNRGTDGRGEAFKKSTYLQLGKLETQDQIDAAKYLQSLPYIDKDRIGIMGWSYGGYMSTLCITKGADVFKMAIAVAPVTNWRYYDNIYTERFMRTPQENPDGYDDNSPINHVSKLKGKYLLIHGTADDNVHFQNSMELVDKLVKANKQFETFFYPNKNHGIHGGVTRLNLYTKMTDFVLKNL